MIIDRTEYKILLNLSCIEVQSESRESIRQLIEALQIGNSISQLWIANTNILLPSQQIMEILNAGHLTPNIKKVNIVLGQIATPLFSTFFLQLQRRCKFITTLVLSNNNLGNASFRLVVLASFKFIKKFWFADNRVNTEGIKQILNNQWQFIKSVDFSNNNINNKGFGYIVSCSWPSLIDLKLQNIGLTNDSCRLLTKSRWPNLRSLNITNHKFTTQFLKSFANVTWPNLQLLIIRTNNQYDDFPCMRSMAKTVAKRSVSSKLKIRNNLMRIISKEWMQNYISEMSEHGHTRTNDIYDRTNFVKKTD